MKPLARRVVLGVTYLLLGFMLGLFVKWEIAIRGNHDPALFGITRTSVVSGSMEPEIKTGSMAITLAQQSYENGDIILYWSPYLGEYILHRVIGVTADGYLTKGDANQVKDPWIVTPDKVVGKLVFHSYMANKLIGLIPFGLSGWILWDIYKSRSKNTNEN